MSRSDTVGNPHRITESALMKRRAIKDGDPELMNAFRRKMDGKEKQ